MRACVHVCAQAAAHASWPDLAPPSLGPLALQARARGHMHIADFILHAHRFQVGGGSGRGSGMAVLLLALCTPVARTRATMCVPARAINTLCLSFWQNEAILLIHFSPRYKQSEIVDALNQNLPPALRAKCVPFLNGFAA